MTSVNYEVNFTSSADPQLDAILKQEAQRQKSSLSLVASCSIAHPSIAAYESSVASNVTAEGYPGQRYHAGCKFIDQIENLAIERCKSAFGAKHVNVQPLSASIANQAVIGMLVPPGGTIMGLSLNCGGHLSHGSKANLSGKHYNAVEFGLGEDGRIDMEGLHRAAKQCRPDLIVFGTTAYPRTLDFKKLREIADDVGAYLLADITHIAGLVIAGLHPNPINYAHVVTTCTHKQLYGPRGGLIMLGDSAEQRCKNSQVPLAKMVDRGIFPFLQGAPNNNMVAAKARILSVCQEPEFKQICENIVSYASYLAEAFMSKGLKVPFEGTDNHIVLLDVWNSFGITGLQAQIALESCNIIVNKNILPNDTKGVKDGSGIRLGTNALALRVLDNEGLAFCADVIVRVLSQLAKTPQLTMQFIEQIQYEVKTFSATYPVRASWRADHTQGKKPLMSQFSNTNEQLQNQKTVEYRHHPLSLTLSQKTTDDSRIASALALTLGRFIQSNIISLNLSDKLITLDLSDDQTIAEYLAQYQSKAKQTAIAEGEARYSFTVLTSNAQWQQLDLPDIVTIYSADTDLAFTVALDEQTQCYHTFWASSSTAFNEQLLVELSQSFEQILTVLCEDQSQTLGPIHALSQQRYQQLVVQTNQTEFDFPDVCLFELFEQKAESQPDAIALVYRGQSYSYLQLNQLSNQLACVLNKHGIGKGDIVAVSMAKSDLFVIALMAVVKSGAAYLPIDPNYPQSRVEMMLDDIKPPLILTVKGALDDSLIHDKIVLELDAQQLQQQMAAASDANPQQGVTGDDLFYAIYTSGSTGAPKAILLNHRGRTSNFLDFIRRFNIQAGDSLLGVSSISFDMTAFDVFGILSCGATLIINGDDLDPVGWAETIVDYEVSVWHSAPALFDLVLQALEQSGPHYDILRLTLLGGDWIPLDMPAKYRAVSPDGIFISLGGASEVSMDSTIYTVNEVSEQWCSIPYGKPMGNQRAYILDEALRPVPVGVAGQLFLGGIGVGNGYHNREELTKERFLPDPFHTPGARMYMTGDCARWMSDGEIELLGRLDFQVKINGLRIELGEIEHAIRAVEGVDKAVVVRAGPVTAGQLVAFYTNEEGQNATSEQITAQLEQALPGFMVPGHIVELQQFKLSPNGKVDRSALMAQAALLVTSD